MFSHCRIGDASLYILDRGPLCDLPRPGLRDHANLLPCEGPRSRLCFSILVFVALCSLVPSTLQAAIMHTSVLRNATASVSTGAPPDSDTNNGFDDATLSASVSGFFNGQPVSSSATLTSSFETSGSVINSFSKQISTSANSSGLGESFSNAGFQLFFSVTDSPILLDLAASLSIARQANDTGGRTNAILQLRDESSLEILEFVGVSGQHDLSVVLPPREAYRLTLSTNASVRRGAGAASANANIFGEFKPLHRWINPAGGVFGVNSNWLDNDIPGPEDHALFDLPDTYTVELTANTTNKAALVRGGNVSLNSGQFRYNLDRLNVEGGELPSSLLVNSTNQITLAEHGLLAREIVVGEMGTLRNSAQLYVGNVDFPPSGSGSNQALTDLQATGSVHIRDGGKLRTVQAILNGPAINPSGIALVEIDGTGSTFEVGKLDVGGTATGRIDITGGGQLLGVQSTDPFPLAIVVDSPNLETESVINVSGVSSEGGEPDASRLKASSLFVGRGRQGIPGMGRRPGKGRLEITNGGQVEADFFNLGEWFQSMGIINVSGAGSAIVDEDGLPNNILVGNRGQGQLIISDGATVDASISLAAISDSDLTDVQAQVQVTGAGSALHAPSIDIGAPSAGQGLLLIEDGAVVSSTGVTLGGSFNPSFITVKMPESKLEFDLKLEVNEKGTLTIDDGASVIGEIGVLEANADGAISIVNRGTARVGGVSVGDGGIIEVQSADSKLTALSAIVVNSGTLRIGDRGEIDNSDGELQVRAGGLLTIMGGGELKTGKILFGGTVTVDQPASKIIASDETTIDPGGELQVMNEGLYDGNGASVFGSLTLSSSGVAEFDQEVFVAGSGLIAVGAGAMTIGVVDRVDGELRVGPGGTLSGTGTVDGTVSNQGGNVAPGFSPGILRVDGDYFQDAAGSLALEIGGLTPGEDHDQLLVTGDASIGGVVVLEFINQFSPQNGDVYEFLTASGQQDLSDANFVVRSLAPGFEFEIVPSAGGFSMVALTDGQFVPEPASCMIACFFGAGFLVRRK